MRAARSELGLAVFLAAAVALAWLFASLQLKAAPAVQFQIVNLCNAPPTYVSETARHASEAYETYARLFGRPPPFYGQIVLRGDMPQGIAGLTYLTCGPTGCWAYKIELACNLRNLDEVVYHEMAHAMQAAFISPSTQYDWYMESSAEGLAAYALRRPTWLYQAYYRSQMWQVSPRELGDYSVRWYYYAAPMAWLIWRYGPQRFAEWATGNYTSYLLFLLSPWDWGKFLWAQEPEYEICGRIELKPYTAKYCRSLYSEDGTAVVSDVPVNATLRPPYLLLAFAAPFAAAGQYTVTPIPPRTVTTTVTITQTETATTTVQVTTTATQTMTETVTATATQTLPITVTITEVSNYTVTYTTTVTQPGISLDPTTAITLSILALALLIAAVACTRCAIHKGQTTPS